MTAPGQLRALRIEVLVEGERLRLRAGRAITEELRRAVVLHKAALLRLLERGRGSLAASARWRCCAHTALATAARAG